MAALARTKSEIYLVGSVKDEFTGSKLPSVHDVFAVYFHWLKFIKETKHEAATHTIQKLFANWIWARILVWDERRAIEKLKSLVIALEKLKRTRTGRMKCRKWMKRPSLQNFQIYLMFLMAILFKWWPFKKIETFCLLNRSLAGEVVWQDWTGSWRKRNMERQHKQNY